MIENNPRQSSCFFKEILVTQECQFLVMNGIIPSGTAGHFMSL